MISETLTAADGSMPFGGDFGELSRTAQVDASPTDWQRVKYLFDDTLQKYLVHGCQHTPLAQMITTIFRPLARRYNNGERSQALYEAMREVI